MRSMVAIRRRFQLSAVCSSSVSSPLDFVEHRSPRTKRTLSIRLSGADLEEMRQLLLHPLSDSSQSGREPARQFLSIDVVQSYFIPRCAYQRAHGHDRHLTCSARARSTTTAARFLAFGRMDAQRSMICKRDHAWFLGASGILIETRSIEQNVLLFYATTGGLEYWKNERKKVV